MNPNITMRLQVHALSLVLGLCLSLLVYLVVIPSPLTGLICAISFTFILDYTLLSLVEGNLPVPVTEETA